MKTITSLAATVGIVITISSCGLGKIRQGVNKIERGMTKEQVTSLLGAPLNRSIQADQSELWEYNFSDFPGNSISVHVTFVNDRVSQFDSKENAPSPARTTTYPETAPVIIASPHPQPTYPYPSDRQYSDPGYYPGRGYGDPYGEEARAFELFYRDVQELIFTGDQIRFIEEVARRSYFTTEQAARLINLFSDTQQRLNVLRALAPRLRDVYNSPYLLDLFRYGDRERAERILRQFGPTIPRQYDPRYGGQVPREEDFEEFLRGINRLSFPKDQIRYVQDAARFNTFTVRQTERILKQFNWDEERLQVLEGIAPHLRDGYNAYRLIECFDFLDAQEKARRLLGLSQSGRYRGYLSSSRSTSNEDYGAGILERMQQNQDAIMDKMTWYQPLLTKLSLTYEQGERIRILRSELTGHKISIEQGVELLSRYFSGDELRLQALELIAPQLNESEASRARFLDLFTYAEAKSRASYLLRL